MKEKGKGINFDDENFCSNTRSKEDPQSYEEQHSVNTPLRSLSLRPTFLARYSLNFRVSTRI